MKTAYSQLRSPTYPSRYEQRKALQNSRAKWVGRIFMLNIILSAGVFSAPLDYRITLSVLVASAAGFLLTCIYNARRNERGTEDYEGIVDDHSARYFRWERRFLLLAFLSGLTLLGLLAYIVVH